MSECDWEELEEGDNLKSYHLTRWSVDGKWANVLPPEQYYHMQKVNRIAGIVIFMMIILVGVLA